MTPTTDRLPVVAPAGNILGPKQGQWTYRDYAALPDDGRRYEIVNGVLYMRPSPSGSHQSAALRFSLHLFNHVEAAGLGRVYIAPFDVELGPNVVVQPDVFVLLNEGLEKYTESRVIGAPDLVVEVSSPGTAIHDRNRKYRVYAKAGVPEYWIADPGTQTVEVLVLEDGEYISLGVFRGQAMLPSRMVPELSVHVEEFFASI